jgi:thioester reductase-like protein
VEYCWLRIIRECVMHYFLTGATGFIGKFLTERLLNRGGHVHVLVRPGSELKFTRAEKPFPAAGRPAACRYG